MLSLYPVATFQICPPRTNPGATAPTENLYTLGWLDSFKKKEICGFPAGRVPDFILPWHYLLWVFWRRYHTGIVCQRLAGTSDRRDVASMAKFVSFLFLTLMFCLPLFSAFIPFALKVFKGKDFEDMDEES